MGSIGTERQKQYVVRLQAAAVTGPNPLGADLAAMTDAALRTEYKAVETLLQAMKRRALALAREIKRRK